MCGITGFWSAAGGDATAAGPLARAMADRLRHRGPDDEGVWVDAASGVALAHRRLSILDLSPLGHQPMLSPGGRYVIVFNGEVYNHRQLRAELLAAVRPGPSLRGHSDTEVMLAAVEAWGLGPALRRFVGMFAFALWDRERHELHLVRDRLGIKPLYYGWIGETLVFGSELEALAAHPGFGREIDRDALALLLRLGRVPAPYCIYRGIYKLPPGTLLTLRSPAARESLATPFWSAREVAERGTREPLGGTDADAVDQLDVLLRDAVHLHMEADVPLGAFLSGGVDSSTVVALMQAQSGRPVRTFSIGTHDDDYDEAHHARAVARHLGTDHTELYVAPEDALAVIPRLPALYDEPFADSSQIPTFLVSELARRDVTVALTGDGGDELFAGYNRHVWGPRLWRGLRHLPRGLRQAGADALTAISPAAWGRLFQGVRPLLPARLNHGAAGYKMHKIARILPAGSAEALYLTLASHWEDAGAVVRGAREPRTPLAVPDALPALDGLTERMLFWDLTTYLPDDILTKVDRASMGVSLEVRVPLLDHRVVEFAWRVPRSMKLRDGRGKWLLRQVLHRYVPERLVDRAKSGFAVPLAAWLRGPLRQWAEALLDGRRLAREGFLDPAPIRRKWSEHLSGVRDWQDDLWPVLMFQLWLEATPATRAERHRGPVGGDPVEAPAAL